MSIASVVIVVNVVCIGVNVVIAAIVFSGFHVVDVFNCVIVVIVVTL